MTPFPHHLSALDVCRVMGFEQQSAVAHLREPVIRKTGRFQKATGTLDDGEITRDYIGDEELGRERAHWNRVSQMRSTLDLSSPVIMAFGERFLESAHVLTSPFHVPVSRPCFSSLFHFLRLNECHGPQ